MQTPPPLPRIYPTTWIGRNWKWFVPLVCLVCVAGVLGLITLIFTIMKSSDAYTGAVSRAEANPALIAALGSPIKEGYFCLGNIRLVNSGGYANLEIPLSGPKNTATLYVNATKSAGEWHFDSLVAQINATQQKIDILQTNSVSP